MTTELKLPDLGGDVTDVTITRWRVAEGASVQPGAILLQVATDKVDTEVPAPTGGVLLKHLVNEGELVPVSAVLGIIGEAGEMAADGPTVVGEQPLMADEETGVKATPVALRVADDAGVALGDVIGTGPGGRITKRDVMAAARRENGEKTGERPQAAPDTASKPASPAKSSPAAVRATGLSGDLADEATLEVRRLAAEHNLNLREVAAGRPLSTLTRYDLLSYLATRDAGAPVTIGPRKAAGKARTDSPAVTGTRPQTAATSEPAASMPAAYPPAASMPAASMPAEKSEAAKPAAMLKPGEELVSHTRNRLLTARATARAAQTIPHVTTWWDVNMAAVLAHRKAHKAEFAGQGVNLTVTAYLIKAVVAGLKAMPQANSTWTDEGLIIKRHYHIGMAVALVDGGLIVPVLKHVDDLSLMGVARGVNDLAERGRAGKLRLEELQEGTFTVTNYGTSGSRFQTPIIVEGQAGILGAGAIEKRAVVVSQGSPLEAAVGDYLVFLPMLTLGFSYDHRILDGATADAFCAAVKKELESWQ